MLRAHRSRKARRRRLGLAPEVLEGRALLATYSMPLANATGLDPARYTIRVGGFSLASGLSLQPSSTPGVLEFAAQTGTVDGHLVGAGGYSSIQFDSSKPIDGARIYLYVVPTGQASPSFPFGQQPANPPGDPNIYQYVEYTQPANGGRPTVDVSTVDAFSFPVTLTLNAGLGQVGQPLPASGSVSTGVDHRPTPWQRILRARRGDSPPFRLQAGPRFGRLGSASAVITRASILSRYQTWVSEPNRAMYRPLLLAASSRTNGQSEGILNPYSHLVAPAADSPLSADPDGALNRVFDPALSTLFSTSGWSLKGTDGAVYSATAGTYAYASQTNPVTGQAVKLPGLRFASPSNGNVFTVFNPLGLNAFVGVNGKAILGTTGAALNQIVLTNSPALADLQPGTYVFGQYFDQANGAATNYVQSVSRTAAGTTITLAHPLPFNVTNDQLVFSPLPTLSTMKLSSGAMVFGGAGFFADGIQQGLVGDPLVVFGNLENQINAALNRGVATAPAALAASANGGATAYWGTQSNWYPAGQPQNHFSKFMHVATVGGQPIFVRSSPAANSAQGLPMGQVYGFAFDENPGPVPPAPSGQPEVPAKFDPVPPGATTFTVTLGPWS